MRTLSLGLHGIQISWSGSFNEGAQISSDLKGDSGCVCEGFNTAVDAIESMILGHFMAGVDVTAPAYRNGISVALEALANRADDCQECDAFQSAAACLPSETRSEGVSHG